VARSAARPGEQILDGPLQHVVGRESNRIPHTPAFQRLVERGERKGRVGSNDHGLFQILVPINNR